jgi:hypothetical protein
MGENLSIGGQLMARNPPISRELIGGIPPVCLPAYWLKFFT